jgi:hypothetical protein
MWRHAEEFAESIDRAASESPDRAINASVLCGYWRGQSLDKTPASPRSTPNSSGF